MRFSVVIPTYNRSEKLAQCLEALFKQKWRTDDFEIVVVNDGSRDDTEKIVQKFQRRSPVSLMLFSQSNRGQGAARNLGVEHARGEIILLIGDDIEASPHLLKEHDHIHREHPAEHEACLGFVTWHPKLAVTPLMRFMEQGGAVLGRFGGHQFAYDLLEGKTTADYRFFYTANISLKRSLLQRFKFDPWFAGYGWEDIELGYRMTKKGGLVLYYNRLAEAFHDHMMSFEDFMRRMRNIGRSSRALHQKYPELGAIPGARKELIFRCLSHPLSLLFCRIFSQNFYFYALSKKYFLEGMKEEKVSR